MTKTLEDYVVNQHGSVKVLDTWRILELNEAEIYPKGTESWEKYHDDNVERFINWCKEKGVTYYAQHREDFFEHKAYELAEKEGNEYLMMENMS